MILSNIQVEKKLHLEVFLRGYQANFQLISLIL